MADCPVDRVVSGPLFYHQGVKQYLKIRIHSLKAF